jgi:hypothetical protein
MLECTVTYENGEKLQVSLPASYFPENPVNDFPENLNSDAISKFLKLPNNIKKIDLAYPNGIGGQTVEQVYNSNYEQ